MASVLRDDERRWKAHLKYIDQVLAERNACSPVPTKQPKRRARGNAPTAKSRIVLRGKKRAKEGSEHERR
jgi:hypothetical protein